MSLGFAKLLVAGITGTASLGVASPFVYTEATRSSQQTLWRRTLNLHNIGTIISCKEFDGAYKVELDFAEKDDKNLGLGLTLRLVRNRTRFWYRNSGEELNLTSTSKEEGVWGFGKNWVEGNNGVAIWDSKSKGWSSVNRKGWITKDCQKNGPKIERIASDKIKAPWDTIDASTIRFETVNKDSGLRWKADYKPTVTFSVF